MEAQVQPQLTSTVTFKDHVFFLAAVFCFWFAIYIYVPTFGVYLKSVGFSYGATGIILGSYGISQILLRLPLGLLSDFLREYQKHLLGLGFLMALISGLLFVYFDSFLAILVARILAGVTASMWVTATILYSNYYTGEKASQAMSLLQLLTVVAQFISMVICGYLVQLYNFSCPFWVGAVASFIGMMMVFFIKEVRTELPPSNSFQLKDNLIKTIKTKHLNTITGLSMTAHAILFSTIFGFSPIYAAQIGVSEQAMIILISAFFIPHALSSFILSFYHLSKKKSKWLLVLCLGLSGFFLLLIPTSKTLFILSLYHAFLGLLLGFVFPILLGMIVRVGKPETKMSTMGYYQSFYAIGIFAGPLIAGKIAEALQLGAVFVFTALLAFAACLYGVFSHLDLEKK